MNRIALSIALALGIAAGAPALAGGPDRGVDHLPAAPDWFAAAPEGGIAPLGDPEAGGPIVARGRRSYSEERALGDARSLLERAVSEWLAPDVPADWTPPADLIDALVLDRHVDPVLVDPGRLGLADDPDLTLPAVLHVAALRADLSPERRGAFLDAHRHQVGAERRALLGGLGAFALSCLAILALYIRADEASRGYYTNRLRLAALASAGAAGAVIYRVLT